MTEEKDALQTQSETELHAVTKEKNEKLAAAESMIQIITEEKDLLTADYEKQIAALLAEKEELIAKYEGTPDSADAAEDEKPEADDQSSVVYDDSGEIAEAIEAAGFDFFGTWYVDELCSKNICFSIGDIGMQADYTFNIDNTVSIFCMDADNNEIEEEGSWTIVDGVLTVQDSEEGSMTASVKKNGDLLLGNGDISISLQREVPLLTLVGHVDQDAEKSAFYGDWKLEGWLLSGVYIPIEGFGYTGSIEIEDDEIEFTLLDKSVEDIPYEFVDGTLTFEYDGALYVAKTQDNGKLRVVTNPDPENEFCLIFGRE